MQEEIAQLANLTKEKLDKIYSQYCIKIPAYLLEQIKKSKFIAKQFLPSIQELEKDIPILEPFKGMLKTDIRGFERLYEDRVVFKLISDCPAYCRFCYRKSYVFGKEKVMTKEDINKAISFVTQDDSIRDVLLTGGTPILLGVDYIEKIIKEVVKISHINQIYLALGRPIMDPSLITKKFAEMLAKYNKSNSKNPMQSKKIACTVHINHPDELTVEVVEALHKLTSRGIQVWTQTTLLKDINDSKKTMKKLVTLFSANNLIPYYLIHAMPMIGSGYFRTPIQRGIEIMKYLEQYSGHERPHYIVIPAVGKVQLTGNSQIKYKLSAV